ncbi:MAG TPA: hypothetical protein HPP77_07030 [Candidatus Hydrogenedentes bacterium]|nr:hypothetical protein [Candidatus Hydrogenedentota bacterium]HIJ74651.1 hypothetical protein [Candidatus Hydrogenedentota bacterium]
MMRRSILICLLLTSLAWAGESVQVIDNGDGTMTARVPLGAVEDAPVGIERIGATDEYEAKGARLTATFRPDSCVEYTAAGETIAFEPSDIWFDDLNVTASIVSAPHTLDVDEGQLATSNLWGKGIGAVYAATDGAVKETLNLPQAFLDAIPVDAKVVEFRWALSNPGDLPVVHVLQGVMVGELWIEPIEAHDADGNYLPGHSEYRDGEIVGILDGAWLRTATAPVSVDPSVSSGAPTADVRTYFYLSSPPYNAPYRLYFKVTLPDLNGGTCTEALFCATTSWYSSTVTPSAYVSQDVTWDESSNVTTMNAISTGSVLDNSTTIAADETEYSWDVTGDASKGVIKAYDDECSAVTIILEGWNGTPNTVGATLELQDAGMFGAKEIVLYDRTDGSDYPYLKVTYTAGGESRVARPGVAIGGALRY